MMKNYTYWLYGIAAISMLAACDVNDKFDLEDSREVVEKPKTTPVVTLGASDYKAIADNSTNQKLAAAKGEAEVNALNAIATNKYFVDAEQAQTYLPAYISKLYPTYSDESKVKVACSVYRGASEYMADFASISAYTLDATAYEKVWGDKVKASYLAPSTVEQIPSLLKEAMTTAQEGDIAAVSYAYSDVEPSIGGGSSEGGEEVISYTPIADVITAGAVDATVKGEVIALHAKGMLINDGTASIQVYLNAKPNYSVGDVIEVIGKTAKNYGFYQFDKSASVRLLEHKSEFAYPTSPTVVNTAEGLDALATPSIQYVKLTGTMAFSGSYYNIVVGEAKHKGSVQYAIPGLVDADLDGQEVDVIGYVVGYSGSYVNIMTTSVTKSGEANEYTPVGVIAKSAAGTYKAKGQVAGIYSKGFLLTDGSGLILVYLNATHSYVVGDVVTVSGATSVYNGFVQFGNTSEVTKVTNGTYYVPTPFALTATEMEAYLDAPYLGYVSYEGTLAVTTNSKGVQYFNVTIEGSTKVQGSISYPVDAESIAALDGKKVVVTGYAIGASSGKYLNTMAASVVEATVSTTTTRAVSEVAPNKTVLYTYTGSEWKEYTHSSVLLSVWQPSDYADLGTSYIQKPNVVLPTYLSVLYPYVVGGETAVVVYNAGTAYAAAEYQYKDGSWVTVGEKSDKTLLFEKQAGNWTMKSNEYFANSLLGDEAGFTITTLQIDESLSYIWSNSESYGWKASGYKSGNKVTDSWLVSPAIELAEAEAPYLTFDEAVNYLNGNDLNSYCVVAVTEEYNGEDASASTWTVLELPKRPAGSDWTFVNVGQVDLSAYAGKTIYIGFHYLSDTTVAPTWEFKNLLVTE